MKVIICGGRDFDNITMLTKTMDAINAKTPITLVITGGATGADMYGDAWAHSRGIPHRVFPAYWKEHGHAAGPIRNKRMLTDGKPDMVVAFPGGKGTANMIKQATAHGVTVVRPAP